MDAAIAAFRRCFPRNARPSSRAAYLLSYDGPLPRSTFEDALDATDAALGEKGGPSSAATPSRRPTWRRPSRAVRGAAALPARRPRAAERAVAAARGVVHGDGRRAGVRRPRRATRTRGGRCSRCRAMVSPARADAHRRRRPRVGAAGRRRLGRVCGEPAARRGDAGGRGGGDDRAQPARSPPTPRSAGSRAMWWMEGCAASPPRCWTVPTRWGRRRRRAGGAPGRADVRAARHGAAAGVGAAAGGGRAGRVRSEESERISRGPLAPRGAWEILPNSIGAPLSPDARVSADALPPPLSPPRSNTPRR